MPRRKGRVLRMKRRCRHCGCTDARPCLDVKRRDRSGHVMQVRACWWISPRVCSACAFAALDSALLGKTTKGRTR